MFHIKKINVSKDASCQTEPINKKITSTQTETYGTIRNENQTIENFITVDVCHTEHKHFGGKSLQNRKERTPRLLFVAGRHGINCGLKFNKLLGDKYNVLSMVKPDAPNIELLTICKKEAANLTSEDILIIWLKVNNLPDKSIINSFTSSLAHTNLMFITEPYMQSGSFKARINQDIHNFNMALINRFQFATKQTKINVFECNNLLNYKHYIKYTNNLKDSAKYKICHKLSHIIKSGWSKATTLIKNDPFHIKGHSDISNVQTTGLTNQFNNKENDLHTTSDKYINLGPCVEHQKNGNFLCASPTQLTLRTFLQTGKLQMKTSTCAS